MKRMWQLVWPLIVAAGSVSPVAAGPIQYEMNLAVPVNYGETGGGVAFFLDGGETVYPGYIHLFGTIKTDGTMGVVTPTNIVEISLSSDSEYGSNGPVTGITSFTTEGPSVFYADAGGLYWNKQASSSPDKSNFILGLETGDEFIDISGFSGDGQLTYMSILVGRGPGPEFLLDSPFDLELDFFAHSFVYPTNSTALLKLANAVVSEVPEPSSLVLMSCAGLGLAGYGVRRRRR